MIDLNHVLFLNLFLQKYIIGLLETTYFKLGPDLSVSESHLNVLNRVSVLTWLCYYGYESCRTNATAYLKKWKNSSEIIPPDLQAPYFCGAMAEADQEDWDFLYSQYENATEEALIVRMLNGLGCSENATILEGYLDKTVNENSTLKSAHRVTAFSSVYNAGNVGLSTALTYIKEHIAELNK